MTSTKQTEKSSNLSGVKFDDLKFGDSVVGYIKTFAKSKKSKFNPDQEHPILVTKDNKEVWVWAKSTIRTLRSVMEKRDIPMGCLIKLTKTPVGPDYKGKATFFVDVTANRNDQKSLEELNAITGGGKKAADSEGFEY